MESYLNAAYNSDCSDLSRNHEMFEDTIGAESLNTTNTGRGARLRSA